MIREFGFIDVMYLVGAARWTLLRELMRQTGGEPKLPSAAIIRSGFETDNHALPDEEW